MRKRFEGELAILERVLADRSREYRSASWLHSDYEDNLWIVRVNDSEFQIDWRIDLPDGTPLTAPRHEVLLTTLKCWLCLQDHTDTSHRSMLSPATKQRRLHRTLHVVDYLLVHADSLCLPTHGLSLLTENDIKQFVMRQCENSWVAVSVYEWPKQLEQLLRNESAAVHPAELHEVLKSHPEIAVQFDDEPMTGLSGNDLVRARVWLWQQGLYRQPSQHLAYEFGPNIGRISELLYRNTLRGIASQKPVPPELLIFPTGWAPIEMPRAPVRSQDDVRMSIEQLRPLLRSLRSLAHLTRIGLPVPTSALKGLDDKSIMADLKTLGRYRTLPQTVVFAALRDSIEFSLAHGKQLVDGYLAIAKLWDESGRPCQLGVFAAGLDLTQVLPVHLLELGVSRWSIKRNTNGTVRSVSNLQYFQELRSNVGLIDLMRVLCGSVNICVGTLMARRMGELDELPPDCLDVSKTRLVFNNRKSGVGGMQDRVARPIPKVAVDLISVLRSLHQVIGDLTECNDTGPLLAYPSDLRPELISGTEAAFRALDLFCDYFSVALDEQGRRYYIRQHQLRRFFAMLFFWGNSFGGLETLRWFLGQTDVEHLYNYITESMPGSALASVKAGYATERILQDAPEVVDLAEFLKERYGAEEFSIMTREELDDSIAELLEDSKIAVEPEFFVGNHGREYRILVKVLRGAHS